MQALGWARLPVALRVGLLLAMGTQIAYLVLAGLPEGEPMRLATVRGCVQAVWLASDVMCLYGALQLAKRTPRATLLVIGYALALTSSALWLGFQLMGVHAYEAISTWLVMLRWLSFAMQIVLLVGWAYLAGGAGTVVALTLAMLLASPPPVGDDAIRRLLGDGVTASWIARAVVELVALGVCVLIATGVRATRPVSPRLVRPALYQGLSIGVILVGVAQLLLGLHVLALGVTTLLLGVVVAGGLFWLATLAVGVREVGEPGVWALVAAGAAWVLAGVMYALALPVDLAAARGDRVSTAGAELWALPLCALAGVVLALIGITRVARARGAEQALRVVSACGGIVVISGLTGLGASMTRTAIPVAVRVAAYGAAFAAAAFGFRAAGRSLGAGADLPTATLRPPAAPRGIDRD